MFLNAEDSLRCLHPASKLTQGTEMWFQGGPQCIHHFYHLEQVASTENHHFSTCKIRVTMSLERMKCGNAP
jgi:hypothetical protein